MKKEAYTVAPDGGVWLEDSDYTVLGTKRGRGKESYVTEKITTPKQAAKRVADFAKKTVDTPGKRLAGVALLAGSTLGTAYAAGKIKDARYEKKERERVEKLRKQQTEKVAHYDFDHMVKIAYEEIMGFNKEAWSMADDPNLAAILDSAQKAESKNTTVSKVEVPKINVPNDIVLAVRKNAENGGSHKLPKNFKRYGTIGAAALAGTLALGATAKAVRDNNKRKNQETDEK